MKTGNLAASWLCTASDHGDELEEVMVASKGMRGMRPFVDHIKNLEDKNVALEKENSQARPSLHIPSHEVVTEANLLEMTSLV